MADDFEEMAGHIAPNVEERVPDSAYENDRDALPDRRNNVVPMIRKRESLGSKGSGMSKSVARAKLEMFDDISPVLASKYLVKGMLDVGAMSVIYGPSNSGKTFFAMDVAFHLAIGKQWRGRRVHRAAVLYLAAEGGSGAANRVVALRVSSGARGVPFALRRAGLDLLRSETDLQEVYDLVQELRDLFPGLPLLIVVDTLSRVMAGGDENAAADMTALIRNIDALREATGAHIMIVHHSGKNLAQGARGHSSLRAATDTEIEIQSEDGYREAQVTKQRDHAGGETFAFALRSVTLGQDQDGDDVTSCVVCEDDAPRPAKRRKLGPQQQLLIETIEQLTAEPSGWVLNPSGIGFPEPGKYRCVKFDDLRSAFIGKTPAANPRDAFKTAFEGLQSVQRLICMNGNLVWRVGNDKPDSEDE